jgi:hypothetical protein
MKKILSTLFLLLLNSFCYCQEKIPEKYIIQVTYTGGNTDKIEVDNYRHLKVPAPIVKDGSLFYDEEFLLLDVKKIKILNTVYDKSISKPKKSKYVVTKARYWNERLHKFVTLNVISDPEAEKVQRESEAEQRKTAIFSRSSETQIEEILKPVEEIKSETQIDKDTVVVSTKQIVFEYDGNGNFKKIENSGIKLVGDIINSKDYNPEFNKIDMDKKSDEYLELSQLIEKKGMYLIEKRMNKQNQIVLRKIAPIHIETD